MATAFAALGSSSVGAQASGGTITGQVTDAATGQPVAQVRVLVSGTTNGTLTADNGRYSLRGVIPGTTKKGKSGKTVWSAYSENGLTQDTRAGDCPLL